MKKIISVLLAAVMLICSVSLIASAVQENEADPDEDSECNLDLLDDAPAWMTWFLLYNSWQRTEMRKRLQYWAISLRQ